MYWMTRCDSILAASILLAVEFGILFGFTVLRIVLDDSCGKACFVTCFISFVLGMIAVATSVFVPSTKTIAAIYVVPKIANSETVHELGKGVVTLAREWLEELRPAKKEGGAK